MTSNLRNFENLLGKQRFNDERIPTRTSEEQSDVEEIVINKFYAAHSVNPDRKFLNLLRYEHTRFLRDLIEYLPSRYESLDASRAWICYWVLHSLALLEVKLQDKLKDAIAEFLKKCQAATGGFGGGPGQEPHLAATYAAVHALCTLGTQKAYDAINRETLQSFLWRLRTSNGAFAMHTDGEADIRGVYCALTVATLTNIYTPELFDNSAEWIVSCQTYEGGFSGCPGMEAHGGYTFCGIAGLTLLNKTALCDIQALLRWLVFKQMKLEGGFQGRTNKLVDGCYSFWQAASFPLVHNVLRKDNPNGPNDYLFDQGALQEYILLCCQYPMGGLIDKPGKARDAYHTCYTLSGLSIAQYSSDDCFILGPSSNELALTHPVYNIEIGLVKQALTYFSKYFVPRYEKKDL